MNNPRLYHKLMSQFCQWFPESRISCKRMNYLEMRSEGYPIGSRMVESAAKQYKARFTGPGMPWSRTGAERLLPVRVAILSSRFNKMWHLAFNSPPN